MKKVKVIDKNSIKSIKYERELLSKLHHPFLVNMYYSFQDYEYLYLIMDLLNGGPFLVNMYYSFQDYEYLYLIMDLLNGGDLRYHISRHKKFTEEQTSKKNNYNFIFI